MRRLVGIAVAVMEDIPGVTNDDEEVDRRPSSEQRRERKPRLLAFMIHAVVLEILFSSYSLVSLLMKMVFFNDKLAETVIC